MASFNKVIIVGNFTRDPELKYTPKGTAVCAFSLGVNESWTTDSGEKKEYCSFIEVTAFGPRAEVISKWHKKGNPILVEGRLRQERWDDKETGKARSMVKVLLDSFTFLTRKSDDPGAEHEPRASRPAPSEPGEQTPGDDDVPF